MPLETSVLALHADGLTKQYRRRPALANVDLRVPQGRVVGLVGPNGAGKSTLLQLACGLIEPTSGALRVLGTRPAAGAAHLAKVGFVAQDAPVYASFTVADHLRLGARLNPAWDRPLAERRLAEVGLNPAQKAGRLSGGQRAQLALTLAAAKRPELLILDEPAAALDPLARNRFLQSVTDSVAELGASAILSSHLLADVERVCDHLVVLRDARVQIDGYVPDLLASHRRLTASRGALDRLPRGVTLVAMEHTTRHSHAVVRADPVAWGELASSWPPGAIEPVPLEELVLGYLTHGPSTTVAGEARR